MPSKCGVGYIIGLLSQTGFIDDMCCLSRGFWLQHTQVRIDRTAADSPTKQKLQSGVKSLRSTARHECVYPILPSVGLVCTLHVQCAQHSSGATHPGSKAQDARVLKVMANAVKAELLQRLWPVVFALAPDFTEQPETDHFFLQLQRRWPAGSELQ